MELNGFNTVMLIFGLHNILKTNIIDVFSYYNSKQKTHTIQGGCFIIRTITVHPSDTKLIYTKYYSIRTVVIIRRLLKVSRHVQNTSISVVQHNVIFLVINLRYQFMCSVVQDY